MKTENATVTFLSDLWTDQPLFSAAFTGKARVESLIKKTKLESEVCDGSEVDTSVEATQVNILGIGVLKLTLV